MGGRRARLRHYLPVLAGAAALAVLVLLAPTVTPQAATPVAAGAGPAAPTYPPGDGPGAAGVAASGVRCGGGARQVPWSHYAPLCQPAFHGDNGGATSVGVTRSTITVSVRYAATSAEALLFQQIAPGVVATKAQADAEARAYVSLFNRTFDLYGRKVVLKFYDGVGDFLQELSGTGQTGAQADAATARSLGAFADVSQTIFNTQPYDDALAAQHIVSVGGLFGSAAQFRAHAPYEYFPGPDCEKTAVGTAALISRSLAGMPAVFAGPGLAGRPRTFALISPDNPMYASCGQSVVDALAHDFGIRMKTWIKYTLSLGAISQAAAQAVNTVSQLKAEGVTTVLCGCDPITPMFLAQDAQQQRYTPEWLTLGFGDTFSQLAGNIAPAEWAHAFEGGIAPLPVAQQEAVTAYHLATGDPHASPPPAYQFVYEPLLLLFDALQAAGPDLTPQTFAAGMDSLPPSLPGGEFGPWRFGPGTVDPSAGFQVLRWDTSAVSPEDGKRGTAVACNGGTFYLYANEAAALPDHRQLSCPAVP
jgi:hypothetical protein